MKIETVSIEDQSFYIEHLCASEEDEKLIEHYTKLGFTRLPKKQEKFVQNHVKPKYDEGCVFMFQNL